MDIYTPCGSEHGIAEAASAARARLAVESRMSPLFVHDPRRGKTLYDWFSLDGNPDADKTWTTTTLEYLDEAGQVQLMTTPAHPGGVRARRDAVQEAVPQAAGGLRGARACRSTSTSSSRSPTARARCRSSTPPTRTGT